jgi:23S rRNA pseudouridine2605 synthase
MAMKSGLGRNVLHSLGAGLADIEPARKGIGHMNDKEDKGPRGPRKPRPGRAERAAAKPGEPAGEKPRAHGPKRFDKDFRKGPRPAPGPAERRGGGKPPEFDSRRRDPRRYKDDLPEAGKERIARRLARAGIASRRDAEALIAAGRVRVNGEVLASPALNVAHDDRIEVDGTEIPPVERTRLFLFHKPAGVVTTNRDPEGRRTVFDILPGDLPRVVTVGRLDINTEGLLLLTNDGGLSRVLELPSTGWLRRYRVRVHGEVDEKALAGLKDGIAVGGVFYGGIEASLEREQGTNAWLAIGLREGKNREVKNVLGALGLEVTRLIRISFGPFQLGELPEGAVQELKGRTLREQLGERLIEEAGANFDAPIVNTFSNKPVLRDREDRGDRALRDQAGSRAPIGEGGLIKNRKRDREAKRENALSRLGTKPQRGGFAGKRSREEEAASGPQERRRANVWMAPGARPQGKKEAAATPARERPSKGRQEGMGEGQRPRWKDKPREQGEGPRQRWVERPREQGDGSRPRSNDRPREQAEGQRPHWKDKPREQGTDQRPRWKDRVAGQGEGQRPPRTDKPREQGEGQRPRWKDKPREQGEGQRPRGKPRKEGGEGPASARPGFGQKRSPQSNDRGRPSAGAPRGKGKGGNADRRR